MTRHSERGAAALEFALIVALLFFLMSVTVPMAVALQQRVLLERAAGHTARFATAAPERPRAGTDQRRPSIAHVEAEGLRIFTVLGGQNPQVDFAVSVVGNPRTALPGDQISVTLRKSVDLGFIGALLQMVGLTGSNDIMMTAEAVNSLE